jgi:hypothetical protein
LVLPAVKASGSPVAPCAPAGFSVGTTTSADFSLHLAVSPFQAQSEISPGKSIDLHRTIAGSTSSSLGRESFAVICPLALLDGASYPVSVRRRAVSLPASFSAAVTDGHLAVRLGSLRPASPKDFHLQAVLMLGTQKKGRTSVRPFLDRRWDR